uniref:Uncharacterized protein n=1 Tax=Arundo donax TaxID=35708 RepID=A0A0A8YK62_ARUDO
MVRRRCWRGSTVRIVTPYRRCSDLRVAGGDAPPPRTTAPNLLLRRLLITLRWKLWRRAAIWQRAELHGRAALAANKIEFGVTV